MAFIAKHVAWRILLLVLKLYTFQKLVYIYLSVSFLKLWKWYFYRAVAENLITPVQERMDDWKKGVVQLEKDHGRGVLFCWNFAVSRDSLRTFYCMYGTQKLLTELAIWSIILWNIANSSYYHEILKENFEQLFFRFGTIELEILEIVLDIFLNIEYKKVHTDMKKASQETCRLQKKVNKGKTSQKYFWKSFCIHSFAFMHFNAICIMLIENLHSLLFFSYIAICRQAGISWAVGSSHQRIQHKIFSFGSYREEFCAVGVYGRAQSSLFSYRMS